MFEKQKISLGSFLFKNHFPLYRKLYINYKNKKDRFNLQMIEKFACKGYNVIDIGANIGFFSRYMSDSVGESGHVYCFEPDTINFRHLTNETKEFRNVSCMQKAVGAGSGTITLYESPMLNVDHRTYEPEKYVSKHDVEIVSIDDFVGNKFKVDLIKMDIQGYEIEALKGMKNTLENNAEIVLMMELWPYGLEAAGSSARELYNFLSLAGFKIFDLDKGLTRLNVEDLSNYRVDVSSDTNILAVRDEGRLQQ